MKTETRISSTPSASTTTTISRPAQDDGWGSDLPSSAASKLGGADRGSEPGVFDDKGRLDRPCPRFIGGRFEVRRELGSGGRGVVYEAFDHVHGEVIALKVLRQTDPSSLYAFKQEFRALQGLRHANLVTPYELIAVEDQWLLTMELIEGEDFVSFVRRRACGDPITSPHLDPRAAPLAAPSVRELIAEADQNTLPGVTAESFAEGLSHRAFFREATSCESTLPKSGGLSPGSRSPSLVDERRLQLALAQLVDAVLVLHQSGRLHRDIKPSNVLVTPEGRVALLDFGIMAILDSGKASSADPAGTPAYMAPEQASPRGCSEKSDWYSLGVMLYEALTGVRPFRGRPVNVMAQKQASRPISPRALVPEVPPALEALCCALLQPKPEARPSGLEIKNMVAQLASRPHAHELRERSSSRSSRSLENFEKSGGASPRTEEVLPIPGGVRPWLVTGETRDVELTLDLVGRQSHLLALHESFERAVLGQGASILISGRSGAGKTALVRRFLTDIRGRATVLEGRCHEDEHVPYKTIDSMVDALTQFLIRMDPLVVEKLIPPHVDALVSAFPVLGRIHPWSMARRSSPWSAESEIHRRALNALHEVLIKLAEHNPVVLFLDDLQWGDSDSLPFITSLIADRRAPILLVGAYRTEDVDDSPMLASLLSWIGTRTDAEFPMQALDVGPLSVPESVQLGGVLLESAGLSAALSERISQEAAGSPFFIAELVRYASAVDEAMAFPTLMTLESSILARATRLGSSSRAVLEVLAVAGGWLDQTTLPLVCRAEEPLHRALAELRHDYFVRLAGKGPEERIELLHDRIREAIVKSLSDERRRVLHAELATGLDRGERVDTELLYAMAHHYHAAGDLVPGERAFSINLLAAETAASVYAYDQASIFYELASEIAERFGLEVDAAFQSAAGEACAAAGRLDKALQFFRPAVERAEEPVLRSALRLGLAKVYLAQLDTHSARTEVHRGLADLSARARNSKWGALFFGVLDFLRGVRILRDPRRFGAALGEDATRARIKTRLQLIGGLCAYFEMDRPQVVGTTLSLLHSAAPLGVSSELIKWCGSASAVASIAGFGGIARRLLSWGEARAQELGDPGARAHLEAYGGYSAEFRGDMLGAERRLRFCLEARAQWLENVDYLTVVAALAWNLMMRGYSREGWRIVSLGLDRVELAGKATPVGQGHTYRCYAGPLLASLGQPEEGARHLSEFKTFIDSARAGDKWRLGQYYAHRALHAVLANEPFETIHAILKAHDSLALSHASMPLQLKHIYLARAYAYRTLLASAQFNRYDRLHRKSLLSDFRRAIDGLKRAASHPILVAHQSIASASLERWMGRKARAERRLETALAIGKKFDAPWILLEVSTEKARASTESGNERAAIEHAQQALSFAVSMEWSSRAESLKREFGL